MSNIDWAALAAPIPENEIKWFPSITKSKGQDIVRNGKRVAGCLAHIDARMVMDRLDSVVGPDNWSDQIEIIAVGNSITATCHLTVWGITRGDTGPTMQANNENAAKEAVSGALKRAAVKFGIGRELYDMEIQWLEWDGYKVLEQPKPRRPKQTKPATNGKAPKPISKPAQGSQGPDPSNYIDSKSAPFREFMALGSEMFGDEWDSIRGDAVERETKGRTRSSLELYPGEFAAMLQRLRDKKSQMVAA